MKLSRFWWLPFGDVPEIGPKVLKSWLEDGRAVQLVDSRTELEYSTGTIAGACHAPVTGLPGSLNRLNLDPVRPVVVLCASGHRSRPGARLLESRGFEVYSLKGGILAWRAAGFPLEKPEA